MPGKGPGAGRAEAHNCICLHGTSTAMPLRRYMAIIIAPVAAYLGLVAASHACINLVDPDSCAFLFRMRLPAPWVDDIWDEGGGIGNWSIAG